MRYESLLGWSLAPAILLLVLSVICTILASCYWMLSDFVFPRAVTIPELIRPDFPQFPWEATFIEYIPEPTDGAIVSGCVGIGAGVVCVLAWYKLRRANIEPERHFWVGFAIFSLLGSFGAALGCLILHYTKKGNDANGCTLEITSKKDQIWYCTREMGICNAFPALVRLADEISPLIDIKTTWVVPFTCRMTVAVKWLQLVVMAICALVIAMFAGQAWVRNRAMKYERVSVEGGKAAMRDEHQMSNWR